MYRIAPAALALAAAFALAPTPAARALAAPVREVFTPETGITIQRTNIEVTMADLVSQDARLALLARIEHAAAAVCQAKPPGGPEPVISSDQARCERWAIGRTAYQVHDPELWAMAVARVRAMAPDL